LPGTIFLKWKRRRMAKNSREINMELKIPDKLTFKRNEVTRLTRLDGKVIDFWEKEFGGLKPVVNKLGEKFYTKKDIEIILSIKQMLIGEKRNKEDIKKIINGDSVEPVEKKAVEPAKKEQNNRNTLKLVRKGLQEILTILDKRVK